MARALVLSLLLLQSSCRAWSPFSLRRTRLSRWTTHDSSRRSAGRSSNALEEGSLVARQNLNVSDIQILSQDPLVYTIPNLLSADECRAIQAHVQHLARPLTRSNPPQVSLDASKLWPLPVLSLLAAVPPVYRAWEATQTTGTNLSPKQLAMAGLPNVVGALGLSLALAFGVILPILRRQAESSSRTSDAVALNHKDDLTTVQPLVDRVVQRTTHAWDQWEAPVVTRYAPGAMFARHGDASPTRGSEWTDLGGQRVITCICYLESLSPDQGGETYFDQLDVAVSPVQGTALVFFPSDSETCVADDRTTHESLPPRQVKWIVQMFGRVHRVPPPLGLPDVFADLHVPLDDRSG